MPPDRKEVSSITANPLDSLLTQAHRRASDGAVRRWLRGLLVRGTSAAGSTAHGVYANDLPRGGRNGETANRKQRAR
jgi:hypothetical protein